MAVSFSVNAMVRGYHIYEDIWYASVSEELPCQREPGNSHDPFAVAIIRAGVTVGHVPRKLSSTYSLFIRRCGSIRCPIAIAVLATAPFSRKEVKYALTCLSSSSPRSNGRPLFFSGSSCTLMSSQRSPRFLRISNVYEFLHV